MIKKFLIVHEDKLISYKFLITKYNDYIIIEPFQIISEKLNKKRGFNKPELSENQRTSSFDESFKTTLEKQSFSSNETTTINNIIKIPVLNRYNSLNYYPVTFPLKCNIINGKIFSEYIILYSFNIKIDNNIDFFYNLFKYTKETFNLDAIYYDEINTNNIILLNNTDDKVSNKKNDNVSSCC